MRSLFQRLYVYELFLGEESVKGFSRGYEHMYTCENYEVERQRHNKQINYTQDSSFFQGKRRARTRDTLQSRRALYYQLSYQGNSAGRGSNHQHNTTQGIQHKANLKPLCYGTVYMYIHLPQHSRIPACPTHIADRIDDASRTPGTEQLHT